MKRRLLLVFLLLMAAVALSAPQKGAKTKAKDDDLGADDLDEALFNLDELQGDRRVQMVKKLCQSKDARAADALVSVLANPKPEDTADLKDLAYRALYRLRSRAIIPELKKMLKSESEGQAVYAIGLLGRTLGPESFPLIEPFLADEGEKLNAAIKALGETQNARAVEMLKATLKRVGEHNDAAVFARMSLIRLGEKAEMKPLLLHYERMVNEAFHLKMNLKYIDSPLKKQRSIRRIQYLWSVEAEVRAYFADLAADLVPALVEAVDTTDADTAKQIVFDMTPRMMDRDRAPQFASMLTARHRMLRMLAIREYLRLNDPGLRVKALDAVRQYLAATNWQDRRFALGFTSLMPEADRLAALEAGLKDDVVWVRIEAVRELGRWRTPQALDLVRGAQEGATHDELAFVCRCALAGVEEDLYGVR
jgi:hypothetical protein